MIHCATDINENEARRVTEREKSGMIDKIKKNNEGEPWTSKRNTKLHAVCR